MKNIKNTTNFKLFIYNFMKYVIINSEILTDHVNKYKSEVEWGIYEETKKNNKHISILYHVFKPNFTK